MQQPLKKFNLQIHGMTCQSCEVLIERKFKKIPGVQKVSVDHRTGKAEIVSAETPRLADYQAALQGEKYTVMPYGANAAPSNQKELRRLQAQERAKLRQERVESAAMILLLFGLYYFLRQTGVLAGKFDLGISESMSYGYIFLIGLAAAVSTCIAVTGGLLLTVSAKYHELYPHLSGIRKFKPHISFNVGRIVSYTVLGGLVGLLGSAITLSTKGTGWLSILASVFMILMAANMLKLPGASRLNFLRMPKFISHKIQDLSAEASAKAEASGNPGKFGPFLLGAGTFFLPCGFTQALQIYALSTGSFTKGALTMLAFSLGTLPALVSIGAVSSFAKGVFAKPFFKFVGAFVLILGIANINNGLALAGSNWNLASIGEAFRGSPGANTLPIGGVQAAVNDPNVTIDEQNQIVRMAVDGFRYVPNHFTIYQDLPVRWLVYGKNAYGCASVLTIPKYGITKFLQQGVENEINFTPREVGELRFSCSMGMYGGSFTVIPRPAGVEAPKVQLLAAQIPESEEPSCAPGSPGCNVQVAKVSIDRDGYNPREIVVKRGVPVELVVDDEIPLGGCMGTLVIPEYNVAKLLKVGKNKVAFNPTRIGTFPITCSMGGRMAQLTVVD